MKILKLGVLLWLSMAAGAWAQQDKSPDKPPDGAPQNRPTLGPPPAPTLRGPRTSTTTDAQKLAHINKIFVDRIDNRLNDKLMEGLSKLGRFRIVLDEKEADAVLRGSCLDSRRLKSVHSEVFISDRATGASIWQDNVRHPFNPPALDKAVDESAATILEHLTDSISEAQRK